MKLEPFDCRPWDIARLTDFQIARWIMAQSRRQEDIERERKGLPPLGDENEPPPEGQPSKAFMLAMFMKLGMSKEDAEKEYAEQAAMAAQSR